MPAQSPTLSPTRSAMTAGFLGSSSGIPASTLPTKSAPTSAAFVKMPPPTRMKSARSVPPKPKPSKASGAAMPRMINMIVPPSKPRPSVNIPVMVPARYAIRSASPNDLLEAAATRTFPSMAIRIPSCPTVREKPAPIIKAIARAMPIIRRTESGL